MQSKQCKPMETNATINTSAFFNKRSDLLNCPLLSFIIITSELLYDETLSITFGNIRTDRRFIVFIQHTGKISFKINSIAINEVPYEVL